ncbi:outer membrane protein assembly factor BamD [bacterium]|nr:outer membrane protein assembly factor BamD [bacterium]
MAFVTFLLPACFGGSPEPEEIDEEPKEVPLSATPIMEGTEDALFSNAKKFYANGYYLIAQDAFRSIVESFPLGPYREFSEIKIADAHFLQRQYEKAAPLYEQILKNAPSLSNAPYVTMRAGRSYQRMNTDLGRDREPLEKAMKHYRTFLEKYPNSMYREQVVTYLQESQRAIAQHEQMVAEFYKKRGHQKAFKKRHRSYQVAKSTVTPDSMKVADLSTSPTLVMQNQQLPTVVNGILVETPDERSRVRARMSPTVVAVRTHSSVEALQGHPAQIVSASLRRGTEAKLSQSTFASPELRDVSCTVRNGRKITVELSENANAQLRKRAPEKIVSEEGTVTLSLPVQLSEPYDMSCFREDDLSISSTGVMTLSSGGTFLVFPLENPPRLMIIEKFS